MARPNPDAESATESQTPPPKAAAPNEGKARTWWHRWAWIVCVALGALALLLVWLLVAFVRGRRYGPEELTSPSQDPNAHAPAQVDLGYATYLGTRIPESGVDQYLGIRYAAPPLGELRWRAPVEPEVTGETVIAHEFKPICLGMYVSYPSDGQDEDCLYANLWAPSNATADSKLPVWLFIQGGGYTSLTNANWNGSDLVARSGGNIVMVEFNYRVGLWGFLASENVRRDGVLNAGLLDQRMMMAWVKKHISKFGGDPDHVVLHGASAGAGSVALHLTSYGGRDDGLYVGAIGQSPFFPAQPYVRELEWQFDKVARLVGCEPASPPTAAATSSSGTDGDQTAAAEEVMRCLRSSSTKTLQGANVGQAFPGTDGTVNPSFYWTPCIDGEMLEDLPYRMLERGRFVKVPIMFGNDQDEGTIFAADASTPAEVASFMQGNFPGLTASDTSAINAAYPLEPPLPSHQAYYPSAARAYGEATFVCPGVHVLDSYYNHTSSGNTTANNLNTTATSDASQKPLSISTGSPPSPAADPPIWSYRYNVRDAIYTAAGQGVVHLSDAAAVFGPDNIGGAPPPGYYTYNANIVPVVMDYYLGFVRALDPNAHRTRGDDDAPEWERWGRGRRRVLLETNSSRMETAEGAQVERCRLWRELAGDMRT